MIRSLEELGLMRRERCQRDRRQLLVGLTRRGRSLTRFARRLFIRSGWAQLAVDSALGTDTSRDNRWHDDMHCLFEMAKLNDLLGRVRYSFGDFATLDYPYGPDE
jgi:DNA-binding MarR family transcriptional regulator